MEYSYFVEMSYIKRALLISAGFLFVALGVIGIFLPVMPCIPFLIIASVCFSKSSKRFHNMLLNNKLVGSHIKRYYENNGIKLKTKVLFIIFQWAAVLGTSIFLVHNLFGRILMGIITMGATIYILSLNTAPRQRST